MNCIFQEEEIENGFFNIEKSDHLLENLHIDDKVMNTLEKATEQFGDAKLTFKPDHNQWSQIENNFDNNSDSDFAELHQNIKCISLLEDKAIVTNFLIEDPLDINKESLNASVDPTTKISDNISSKLDDTKTADKLKTENNEENKTKKQDKEEIKSRGKKSKNNQLDFSNQDHSMCTNEKKARSFGYSRWGRQEDIQLFQTLRLFCSERNINVEDFWNDDIELSENHEKMLKDLKHKVHWRRKASAMLRRIKMLAKDQSLSVRQRIMLHQLQIEAKKSKTKLVVEDIAYMFPGKLIATLESSLKKLKHKH